MTASSAELTIDREALQGARAREARCSGPWTVQVIAGLERRLEALERRALGQIAAFCVAKPNGP